MQKENSFSMSNHHIRILLVDDEQDILEFISYNLKKEGYQVFTANNGKKAIEEAMKIHPHLILLDVMMPELDGIETCLAMKSYPELSQSIIAFLSARGEDYSKITGLEAGADDYITKPIHTKVLLSKVKSLLRRITNEPLTEQEPKRIMLKNITIDKECYTVISKDKKIILPPKEFEILWLLATKVNKVVSRDEIYNLLWGDKIIVGDRTIDVHIRRLREHIGIENIKTIKGVGYLYED